MELRQLECFLAVAQELHFGRAAEKVGMSQSSVSETIKSLEKIIGGALFDRTSRRVSLTRLGENLKNGSEPAIIALRAAYMDCKRQAAGKLRQLRIGFLGGGFYELHSPLVMEFAEQHPDIELEFVELSYLNQFSAIADGTVDTGFCRLPLGIDSLQHGPVVMRDQRMLCVPDGHPFTRFSLLNPEYLAEETLVRITPGSVTEEWDNFHFPKHTPYGKPIAQGPVVRTIREAIAAVASRQGLVMLTKRAGNYYTTPGISFVEIDLPPTPSALAWRRNDLRPVILDLNAILVRIAKRYGTMP
ncbi:LysR family transcriptional regulator [Brucella oryzae]|uniref:LysR family transcriptional regulator n=1 Tax=Brucella oryzae TaxID=335286 RepID=A0A2S7IU94_9HYPH|nr:LysR family transcriptional regulator [Brucella oryzae]MBR7652220.1 LysR family transcriptional regulator [Brucella oryzae]PQA71581.1 LysR family transcriptional regulator [Brucella oryzae]